MEHQPQPLDSETFFDQIDAEQDPDSDDENTPINQPYEIKKLKAKVKTIERNIKLLEDYL